MSIFIVYKLIWGEIYFIQKIKTKNIKVKKQGIDNTLLLEDSLLAKEKDNVLSLSPIICEVNDKEDSSGKLTTISLVYEYKL